MPKPLSRCKGKSKKSRAGQFSSQFRYARRRAGAVAGKASTSLAQAFAQSGKICGNGPPYGQSPHGNGGRELVRGAIIAPHKAPMPTGWRRYGHQTALPEANAQGKAASPSGGARGLRGREGRAVEARAARGAAGSSRRRALRPGVPRNRDPHAGPHAGARRCAEVDVGGRHLRGAGHRRRADGVPLGVA